MEAVQERKVKKWMKTEGQDAQGKAHLWIFFSFKGKGKAQVDSSTWRPHKAKDTWAPAQVETGQIGQTT